MFRYIVKRLAYSLLIVLGIMILTFLLFQVAAGDPASTVLGKNPTPQELEEMRSELGTDKPLFFGRWKPTEMYSGADFSGGRSRLPGIRMTGKLATAPRGLILQPGENRLIFTRNFQLDRPEPVRMTLNGGKDDFSLLINGRPFQSARGRIICVLPAAPPSITVASAKGDCAVSSVRFERPTAGLFDSQLTASVKEIVTFKREFPYVRFFNFGKTLQTHEDIRTKLWQGMWPSLLLMAPVFAGELVLGIVLAMAACVFRDRWADHLILCLSVAGMSVSYLALIIFGQWFLAYCLNWFPVWGWGGVKYLLLPVAIGIVSGTGGGVRFYRTVFLDELNREYLRTAAAKGLGPVKIYFKHLLKNALIPVITRASTVLPFLFTGSLLLETFFGIPGLGYEGVNALNDADLPLLKALVIMSAFLFVLINLLTDLAYAWADPRVRVHGG